MGRTWTPFNLSTHRVQLRLNLIHVYAVRTTWKKLSGGRMAANKDNNAIAEPSRKPRTLNLLQRVFHACQRTKAIVGNGALCVLICYL